MMTSSHHLSALFSSNSTNKKPTKFFSNSDTVFLSGKVETTHPINPPPTRLQTEKKNKSGKKYGKEDGRGGKLFK
jgi:hypothetical protein